MNSQAAFDIIASQYDAHFTESLIGKEQRRISRYWLEQLLSGRKNLQILEMNCGTGEDAFWLASLGHKVIATDASPSMIREARKKFGSEKNIIFYACEIEELGISFPGKKFDLIFSNFAGLNCISPEKMIFLAKDLCQLLDKAGYLAVVVFGKHTWWETFYYLLKGSPTKAFRRWNNQINLVRLKENIYQPVYYYSTTKLAKLFSPLQLEEKKPVGLFVPPAYLDGAMKKRPRFFDWLVRFENKTKKFPFGSSLADHTYLLFKKQTP
ncbi:MAG TPA: class I SAM-dependent methyltransferase [Chitinophagaceae bacterium]|nr:class I SAM-dependent methyltransferase [Chitinophagaceae bacterium]